LAPLPLIPLRGKVELSILDSRVRKVEWQEKYQIGEKSQLRLSATFTQGQSQIFLDKKDLRWLKK
jgi:hypothetical protein